MLVKWCAIIYDTVPALGQCIELPATPAKNETFTNAVLLLSQGHRQWASINPLNAATEYTQRQTMSLSQPPSILGCSVFLVCPLDKLLG